MPDRAGCCTFTDHSRHMATENKDDIIIAMLEEIKSGMKNQKQLQIGLSTVEQLSERMEHHIQQTAAQ